MNDQNDSDSDTTGTLQTGLHYCDREYLSREERSEPIPYLWNAYIKEKVTYSLVQIRSK